MLYYKRKLASVPLEVKGKIINVQGSGRVRQTMSTVEKSHFRSDAVENNPVIEWTDLLELFPGSLWIG